MSPYFTVVIPTFNSANYILNTIESIGLATQTRNYEVILVDDCSEDLQTLSRLIKPIKQVKLVQKKSRTNAADSRNIGYLKSTSRFVFFLDSDDSYLSDAIDMRIKVHQKKEAGIVFGNFITDFGSFNVNSNLPTYNSEDPRQYILTKGGDVRSSVISIDKKYFKDTLFDKNSYKHQDWIFAIRCWNNKEKMFFDNQYLTKINVDRQGRMSSEFNIEASAYFCKKYLKSYEFTNIFSKNNWTSIVLSGDRQAKEFFMSIYKPLSLNDTFRYNLFKLATSQQILPLTSNIFSIIKLSKQKLRIVIGKVI